jgi:hypothetical protein
MAASMKATGKSRRSMMTICSATDGIITLPKTLISTPVYLAR